MGRIGSGAYQILSGTDLWARKEINRVLESIESLQDQITDNADDISTINDYLVAGEFDPLIGVNSIRTENKILNGLFEIAQRGTSFSNVANGTYILDRWLVTGSSVVMNWKQGVGPVGTPFCINGNQIGAGTIYPEIRQPFETSEVIPLQGKTVTVAFTYRTIVAASQVWKVFYEWGKGIDEVNPTGGDVGEQDLPNVGSTWTEDSFTFDIPTDATSLRISFYTTGNSVSNMDFRLSNVRLNVGDKASPYTRAGGTLAGELAACHRFGQKIGGNSAYNRLGLGTAAANFVDAVIPLTVELRIPPALTVTGTVGTHFWIIGNGSTITSLTSMAVVSANNSTTLPIVRVTKNAAFAANYHYTLGTNNSATSFLFLDAEL